MNSKGAKCPNCNTQIPFKTLREESLSGRMGADLIAIVAEGRDGRAYVSPNEGQVRAATVEKPEDYPDADINSAAPDLHISNYGFQKFSELFTNRQLVMLTEFSDSLKEIRELCYRDALKRGLEIGSPLNDAGTGALAYSQAIAVYLSFVIDKLADRGSTVCSWDSSRDGLRNTFGRQAIPMVWDYAEGNPFCTSSGCYDNMLEWVVKCVPTFVSDVAGYSNQKSAMDDCGLDNIMVSTDPPYYNNIAYADLSDYFYIWMRRALVDIYPDIFSTMLVPKAEELVALKYRFSGDEDKAKEFFEDGMFKTFKQLYPHCSDLIPVTIYYAYKQSESSKTDDGVQRSSSGWETMLSAVIRAGFEITGTWPFRTELSNRMIGIDSNALASSIVLVCRKKSSSDVITRREFVNNLRKELKPAMKRLQNSNIAPVDLAQSAIGPGISVFSRYSAVLESDGSQMTVRSALEIINQELDFFVSEQEGDMDPDRRFCVELYSQFSYNEVKYGEADVLARAKNVSIEKMVSNGSLFSEKGVVRLRTRDEIEEPTKSKSNVWVLCQQLTREIGRGGIEKTAEILLQYAGNEGEDAKALAYRLFTIADRNKWTQEAYAYNSLIIVWPEIQARLIALLRPSDRKDVASLDRWIE